MVGLKGALVLMSFGLLAYGLFVLHHVRVLLLLHDEGGSLLVNELSALFYEPFGRYRLCICCLLV